MTTNNIVETSTTLTSTFLASVVIFDSPVYTYLAVISGFVGMLTAANDLDEIKKLKINFYSFFTVFKGAFIGFFSAPLLMLFLVLFGNQIGQKIGIAIGNENPMLISIYWILSLLFSRVISKNIFNYLERSRNER